MVQNDFLVNMKNIYTNLFPFQVMWGHLAHYAQVAQSWNHWRHLATIGNLCLNLLYFTLRSSHLFKYIYYTPLESIFPS